MLEAIDMVVDEPERRQRLWRNQRCFVSRLQSCGVTPLSVLIAMATPATTAFRNDSRWISMVSLAFCKLAAGICAPASAASITPCGATSVGTR